MTGSWNDPAFLFWEAFGLLGQLMFFGRLLVQWIGSERARRPVLPLSYWYFSLAGAAMVFVYALHKDSPSLLVAQFVGALLYVRNLHLELRHRAREAWRARMGFDTENFPWPMFSVIVPARNEEASLAATLNAMERQAYPGPRPEVIVVLNACTDGTRTVAERYGAAIVEEDRPGIGRARNRGAREAAGDLLLFVDADTTLPVDGLRRIAECMHGTPDAVAGVAARPARGLLGVHLGFVLMNEHARRAGLPPPSGVTAARRSAFARLGGFDERLARGTSLEFFLRARARGVPILRIDAVKATTSIRDFAHKGIFWRMARRIETLVRLRRGERRTLEIAASPRQP